MAQLRLLQECNHEVVTRIPILDTVTLRRGYKADGTRIEGNIDFIEQVPAVSVIDKIVQNVSGTYVIISPEIYNLYNNRVIWTRGYVPGVAGKYRAPNIGEVYTVYLKRISSEFCKYGASECVRCNGTGWYVAPLSLEHGMQLVSGPLLVAQEFIKCLLTTAGSDYLDSSYGASLLGNNGAINYIDKNLINNIRNAVKNAEIQCRQNINLESRTVDEILDRVIINTIEPDYANAGVCVNLTLYTLEGSRVSFDVNI